MVSFFGNEYRSAITVKVSYILSDTKLPDVKRNAVIKQKFHLLVEFFVALVAPNHEVLLTRELIASPTIGKVFNEVVPALNHDL